MERIIPDVDDVKEIGLLLISRSGNWMFRNAVTSLWI
jgi:hypothetical protein